MIVTIKPGQLKGSIDVIASKSLSHRYVIAASLAKGTSVIEGVADCDDLTATKEALKHFGVMFNENQITGTSWIYDGSPIDCMESGSTLRFLIPLATLQDQEVVFIGRGRLVKRPLGVYHELFSQKGIFMESQSENALPLVVKGRLTHGTYHVQSDVSSQFITGLLFTLPLLLGDSKIIWSQTPVSKGYIDLTIDVLHQFGIVVKKLDSGIFIPGSQCYQPLMAKIEGDYSQAAFWMVAGLISGNIAINNLNPKSKQGDKSIVDIIKKMQGNISLDEVHKTYIVKSSKTKGTSIDLNDIPDLGPILMVLASLSEGRSHFINVNRLIDKESNRLDAMVIALKILGVQIHTGDNEIWIQGQKSFHGNVTLSGASDHRIVMALSIAALRAKDAINITDGEAIRKSYPTFFEMFRHLGGTINESQ